MWAVLVSGYIYIYIFFLKQLIYKCMVSVTCPFQHSTVLILEIVAPLGWNKTLNTWFRNSSQKQRDDLSLPTYCNVCYIYPCLCKAFHNHNDKAQVQMNVSKCPSTPNCPRFPHCYVIVDEGKKLHKVPRIKHHVNWWKQLLSRVEKCYLNTNPLMHMQENEGALKGRGWYILCWPQTLTVSIRHALLP